MSIELAMLLASAALLLALPIVYGAGMVARVGGPAMLGNRDGFPEVTGWPARGKRAHQNLLENLLPFAIAVLATQQAGVSNAVTTAGAVLFLVSRLAHAGSYLAGITVARTLAFYGGTLGTILVASQLV